MTVSAISSLKILYPAKTAQGNDYKKSNIGKYVGTGLGVATASKFAYDVSKISKSMDLKRAFVAVFQSIVDTVDNMTNSDPIPRADFRALRKLALSRGIKIATPLVGVLALATGYTIGAIGDGIANCLSRKSADKKQA